MLDLDRWYSKANAVDSVRSREISSAYEDVGLEEERTKGFDGAFRAKSWGAEIHGIKGSVGAPNIVRVQMFRICVGICSAQWATRRILRLLQYLCSAASCSEIFTSFRVHVGYEARCVEKNNPLYR